jgi:glycosyltransferase involved in cell wall biosynthesis
MMAHEGSAESVPVSVLIPVRNEQRNILDCLASVAWASEVVVIDSASSDATARLALDAGARVIQFAYVPGGPRKKNWALHHVDFQNEWILILDADERITEPLAREIRQAVADPHGHSGFYINRRFNFLGHWIAHAGYYPSWNMRLVRRGRAAYEVLSYDVEHSGDNEVHEHVILQGSSGFLRSPMDHFAYPTLADFVEKHLRYAHWEAALSPQASAMANDGSAIGRALSLRRTLKTWGRRIPFPHWFRFAYHYFLKAGFLDGRHGYVFCHLLAEYEFWVWVRRTELRSQSKREQASDGKLKAVAPTVEVRPFTAAAEAGDPAWRAPSREL